MIILHSSRTTRGRYWGWREDASGRLCKLLELLSSWKDKCGECGFGNLTPLAVSAELGQAFHGGFGVLHCVGGFTKIDSPPNRRIPL